MNDADLQEQVKKECYQPAYDVTKQGLEKHQRSDAFLAIREDFKVRYAEAHADLTADELALLPEGAHLKVETLSSRYLITVETGSLKISIDEEGRIWKTDK